jgi:hypothetical protein
MEDTTMQTQPTFDVMASRYLDYLIECRDYWSARSMQQSRSADPESHARYAVLAEIVGDLQAIFANDQSSAVVRDLAKLGE